MADKYDVIWDPRAERYIATHAANRKPGCPIWQGAPIARDPALYSARTVLSDPTLPDVVMVTLDSYSAAVRAIGNYPTSGAYV